MRRRFVGVGGAALLVVLGALVLLLRPRPQAPDRPAERAAPAGQTSVWRERLTQEAARAERSRKRIEESQKSGPRNPMLDPYGAEDRTVQDDLRLVRELLAEYRVRMGTGELPPGVNAEIVAELLGDNPKRIPFLPADHPLLNEQGELMDRYGTPLFFHALSSAMMELRSAGPDRQFWTEDDIVVPEG